MSLSVQREVICTTTFQLETTALLGRRATARTPKRPFRLTCQVNADTQPLTLQRMGGPGERIRLQGRVRSVGDFIAPQRGAEENLYVVSLIQPAAQWTSSPRCAGAGLRRRNISSLGFLQRSTQVGPKA